VEEGKEGGEGGRNPALCFHERIVGGEGGGKEYKMHYYGLPPNLHGRPAGRR